MNIIFADTSYLIALVESTDQFHKSAVEFSRSNQHPILTTSAIILELGAKFSRAPRRAIFLRILEILAEDNVQIIFVDLNLQQRGVKLFAQRPDKNWSLVDCISFIVMQDRGIQDAATSDEHFEQAGFTALLRTPHPKKYHE